MGNSQTPATILGRMADSSAKICMDIGRYKIASQEENYREFTGKTLRLASYTALMFGLGGTVVGFTEPSNNCLIFLLGLQFVPLGMAGVAMANTAKPVPWWNFPELKDMYDFLDEDSNDTCKRMVQFYDDKIKKNRETLKCKVKWLKIAVWSTITQLFLLALLVGASLFYRW